MNHDVGIGVVTTVASVALPPCSRLDRRSCWLNNSLLRPPHSGRHRCGLLGRGYPDVEWVHSHIPPSIIIASIYSTDDAKNEESKRWTCVVDAIELMQSQRRVDSNERDSVQRNQFILYVFSDHC
eukprot:scaffold2643_cov76-Skeletonema_marinoi.AAC.1